MTEYTVIIEHDPKTGSYGASTPDLPVDGIGKSREEAIARFRNALTGYIAFMRERGEPVPPPRHTAITLCVDESA
jgi:predicted RNase H-like HicB family nuclease